MRHSPEDLESISGRVSVFGAKIQKLFFNAFEKIRELIFFRLSEARVDQQVIVVFFWLETTSGFLEIATASVDNANATIVKALCLSLDSRERETCSQSHGGPWSYESEMVSKLGSMCG